VTLARNPTGLPEPFLVLATQNPIEQEGTYSLPEAQVNRFMLKVVVTYPSEDEEKKIMRLAARTSRPEALKADHGTATILEMRKLVDQIHVDDQNHRIYNPAGVCDSPASQLLPQMEGKIRFGGSPRASIYLNLAAKARAFLSGRGYVTPQDVKRSP